MLNLGRIFSQSGTHIRKRGEVTYTRDCLCSACLCHEHFALCTGQNYIALFEIRQAITRGIAEHART